MSLRNHFVTVDRPFIEGNVEGFEQTICEKNIIQATLSITALGVYVAYIDGVRVGDAILTPGYTYYPKNLHYQVFDVTKMLKEKSKLTVYLGQGWYCGRFTFNNICQIYGENPAVSWILNIKTSEGEKDYYSSDVGVKNIIAPYEYAGLYDGEIYSQSNENKHPLPVIAFKGEIPETIEESEMLVRIREMMPIKEIIKNKDSYILDFGQNFAGIISIDPSKMKSDVIKIRHGEILNEDKTLYTTNLRKAKQTIIYHKGNSIYTPNFTYMGFRYIEITLCDYVPGLIRAYAVYSDMERTGYFECSEEYVNRIYQNQIWGQKSNYIEVPTDCPQRDERMGYTGDGQVFACTGSYNFNTSDFWHKFLKDIRYSQMDSLDGYIPATVPAPKTPSKAGFMSMLGWGNCDLIVPELMYNMYGDISFIEKQYDSMKAFVECEISKMGGFLGKKNLWISPSLGDWLALGKDVKYMALHNGPVSNAFIVNDLRIMIWASKLLNKNEDTKRYEEQYTLSRDAYIKAFIKTDGKMKDNYQGAYIMALKMVLTHDSDLWNKVYNHLKEKIKKEGMQTGFFATEHVFSLLAENGDVSLAYDLIFNEKCPGWIYQIKHGATTCWERWDAIMEDGNVNESKMSNDNMVSFNHYSFGSVGRFYYEHILGITPTLPGFENVSVCPKPDKRIKWAKGSFKTKHGDIVSEWKYEGENIVFNIETPVSTIISLPNGENHHVFSGTYQFKI